MTPDWNAMAVVGTVARAHGNRGEIAINPETDFPDARFQPGARLFVRRNGTLDEIVLAAVRSHKGRPVARVEGVTTIEDAERLAGLDLKIPREELFALPAGSYYHHDLAGCTVSTTSGEAVGRVSGVEGGAGGSRLVVDRSDGGEVLVPMVASICVSVDLERRRIVINPPEGLLDLNAR